VPSYDVTAHTSASPATVYAVIADVARWADWQLITAINPEDRQAAQDNLVGTVWVIRDRGTTTRVRITELIPGRRLSYATLSEPVSRDYRATIDLAPAAPGGTDIRWHATFQPRIPGTGRLLEWFLRPYMSKVVARLAGHARTLPGRRNHA
jgi:hypothetical protein